MPQLDQHVLALRDFRGGLNNTEPPDQIGETQLAAAVNVEYSRTRGVVRRRGSVKNITGAIPFGGGSSVVSLIIHTPGGSLTAAELFGVDNQAVPVMARLNAGTSWAAVTVGDAIAGTTGAAEVYGVTLNGKLFVTYNSAQDRIHVVENGVMRRAGLATPAAATVANTGAGAYAAVLRYYKVAWLNGTTAGAFVMSPLSASVSFTPSGAGTAARITRPALANEHETHWRIFGSADDLNYYPIATVVVGTTTFDDSTAPSSYATVDPGNAGFPTQADYFTVPISGKYLLVDGAQLLLAGSWETAAAGSRVYFTPPLGTTGFSVTDDERIPSTNYLELDPQAGGDLTGLGGPIDGTPIAFKEERIYRLVPTTDPERPYKRVPETTVVGAIHQKTIIMGEDETGAPALYFLSRRGPCRIGRYGVEYLGTDIEATWDTINFAAAYPPHGVYHRAKGQVWWWVATGVSDTPTLRLKFHVQRIYREDNGIIRGGWTTDDGNAATATASVMFADTLGATMARRLKPYAGKTASGGEVYKHDADGENRDDNDAVAYQASFTTRALQPAGMGQQFGVPQVYVQGIGAVTLDCDIVRDFGAHTQAGTVTLTATRGVRKAENLELSECQHAQIRVRDQSALDQYWEVDAIGPRVRPEAAQ